VGRALLGHQDCRLVAATEADAAVEGADLGALLAPAALGGAAGDRGVRGASGETLASRYTDQLV
jgi:hypothetical protein